MATESAPKLKLLTPCELESLGNILGQRVIFGIQPAVRPKLLRAVRGKVKFVKSKAIAMSQITQHILCSVNMKEIIQGDSRSVVTSDPTYRKQAKRVKDKTKIK